MDDHYDSIEAWDSEPTLPGGHEMVHRELAAGPPVKALTFAAFDDVCARALGQVGAIPTEERS